MSCEVSSLRARLNEAFGEHSEEDGVFKSAFGYDEVLVREGV